MSEVNQSNPENNEIEERKIVEVWILDDNEALAESLMRGWESVGDKFGFEKYATAKEALVKIEELIQNNKGLPNVIFVDGNLDKDAGELRNGANFIFKVRKLEVPQPMLIAHSNSSLANRDMMQAGADTTMAKGASLRDYMSFFNALGRNTEIGPES